jgi:hypothetical protein
MFVCAYDTKAVGLQRSAGSSAGIPRPVIHASVMAYY